MADGYLWSDSRGGGYRLPGPNHLGWWAAVAMLLSVLLHVVVFFALDRMKFAFSNDVPHELNTRPIVLRQPESESPTIAEALPPEEVVKPPTDTAKLLDDVELLELLPKDQEIEIKPQVLEAEYAMRIEKPAMEGDPKGIAPEVATGFNVDMDLPELGRQPETIKPAELGQMTVDPGAIQADDNALGHFTDDLIKKGANGKVSNGTLDGITSLDNMLDLPANVLVGKKTMLPSDLLFEFNSADLRESAKVGLMKLGLLMDRNPNLYCWIEGHTDLVGGDEFNLNLSVKRAEAVKNYLVASLRMDPTKIITRGFGRFEPLVISGTPAEQAVNRRVEIRMRQTLPTKDQMKIEPQKAAVIEEARPPKAVLVKPKRALPVEEEQPPPLRAAPVEEEIEDLPPVPRAKAIEPEILKAQAVEE